MKVMKKILLVLGALFLLPMVTVSLLLIYWDLRKPPSFAADPVLQLETWTAVPPGDTPAKQHQSNTDLTFYRDYFFLVHQRSKWHLEDKNGELVIQKSKDAKNWEEVARITVPNTDVRDPKFAIIRDRLFL